MKWWTGSPAEPTRTPQQQDQAGGPEPGDTAWRQACTAAAAAALNINMNDIIILRPWRKMSDNIMSFLFYCEVLS